MYTRVAFLSLLAVFFISSSACLAAPPVLAVSPTYMEFTANEGGANPDPNILSIWRDGGNGPLNWTVTEDCNWLTVDPNSGKSQGEVDDCNVIVDISSLTGGLYNCQLTVDAGTAANSPQIVDVNLTVIGPNLALSSTYFEFTAYEGGVNPDDQILTITNTGGGTLNWQVAEDCSWLSAEPNSGSSTGEADDANLSVDITALAGGIYNCQLTVSDSNASNSPQIVDVNLFVYTDINLVGWWKFDDGSGSTAIDSSGKGNNGTLQNGPIWTTGLINGALDFDGSNDYIGAGDDSSLDISGAITLSAWVKLDNNTNDQQITGKTESGGGYSGGGYRLIFLTGTGFSDGTFRLAFLKANGIGGTGSGNYGTNTNWDRVVSEKNNWQTDTWYHVAATWDGTTSSQSMKMYVNGAPDANHTASQSTIKTNNNALQIGRTLYTSPASQFDGTIDDVRIYDRALSAGEILQLFQDGLGGTPFIELSSKQFEFTALEGGANPNDQVLTISNIGAGTLNWQITEDCNWLSSDPNTGSSTGEADDANLSVDITGLAQGTYNCNLTVSDSNASNSPQIVDVNLFVGDGDGLLYVPSEYSTIQAAIDVALEGDTVIVAPGTYTGAGNRDLDFGGKAITVQSTDPEDPCVVAATVIDCENVSGHRGFYFHSGEDANSIVAGLTVKRGNITGDPAQGGGIYCSGASPTIENCIITKNKCSGSGYGNDAYGGGIYCESVSNPRIINCLISNNEAEGSFGGPNPISGGNGIGGGIYCSSSNAAIENCIIANNTAEGGEGGVDPPAFFGYSGGDAYGGGIQVYSAIVIDNCIIINNSAIGGEGGFSGDGSGGDAQGAGMRIRSTSVTNCTVANNTATGGWGDPPGSSCGGIRGISSTTIINCIVWGNGDDLGGCSATYSCIEDGDAGTGNINSDPCFVSGPEGDYYLIHTAAGQAVDSPCVNVGSDTAANLGFDVYTTRTDYQPDRGTVDMGYHYPSHIVADIHENWHVDLVDFVILAGSWKLCIDPCDSNGLSGDLTGDYCVDVNDLWSLVDCWLDCYVTKAFAPNPSNNDSYADPNAILSWMAGGGALNHDVYFGTDYNGVNDATTASAEYMGRQGPNSWDPCGLNLDTTYYWRIDEVGPAACMTEGDVWTFKTWLEPNLISLWKFDEGSGTTSYDSAGNNDGTIYDANWVTGKIGSYALEFDGDEDYVDIGDKSSLELSSFTVSVWIKPANVSSLQQIAGKHGGAASGNCGYGYRLEIHNGKVILLIDPSGCSNRNPLTSTTSLQTGQWYFVAGTYDGTTAKIYVDGEPENNGSRTLNSYYTDFYVGISYSDYHSAFYRDFNGIIDDVRIYDRALSAGEVWQLYQDGLP